MSGTGMGILEIIENIAFAVAGIATLMFAISSIGQKSKEIVEKNDKIRNIFSWRISRYGFFNAFYFIFIGIACTVLVQSAGVVSTLCFSLVSAGVLSVREALFIIGGSRFGTSINPLLLTSTADFFKCFRYMLMACCAVAVIYNVVVHKKIESDAIKIALFLMLALCSGTLVSRLKKVLDNFGLVEKYLKFARNHTILSPLLTYVFGVFIVFILSSSSTIIRILSDAAEKVGIDDFSKYIAPIVNTANIGTISTILLNARKFRDRRSKKLAIGNLIVKLLFPITLIPIQLCCPWLITKVLNKLLTFESLKKSVKVPPLFHALIGLGCSFVSLFAPLIEKLVDRFLPPELEKKEKGIANEIVYNVVNGGKSV